MKRLNAIDLGLSVLWADKNLYADDAMDTGEEMSVNHAFLNLIENEDSWDEWRLPTLDEIKELMSSKKTANRLDGRLKVSLVIILDA